MVERRFVDTTTEDIISKLAQDEVGKRQFYRPIYSIHKWWARRPGALFRSIILQAYKKNANLFNLKDNFQFKNSEYFLDHNFENLIVLDPFMGGGTTLVEANRLGAKVIGCDLNPVSYWIVRETLKNIDLQKLKKYFYQLEIKAGNKIKSLYETNCVVCKSKADGIYNFWLRYVECPHCGEDAHLFKRTYLNKGLSRTNPISKSNPATLFCPYCFQLNDWSGKDNCKCKHCNKTFSPDYETFDKGYFKCTKCGREKISLIKTLQSGQKLKEMFLAIEYSCHSCKRRLYKSADKNDLIKLRKTNQEFENLRDKLVIPKQEILKGDSSARWLRHNYKYYYQVFNERQLLAFNILIDAIKEIPDEEYRNSFFTVFSNSLEYNNMMTPYNYPHRKLHHLFNYHAMPLTTTPVENSVWGVGKEGAGTFINCYLRYLRAKEYSIKPFDKYINSNHLVHTVYSKNEKIGADFVSTFEKLKQTPRGALLLCGDSADLQNIPPNSVDVVITDPPYFDSIHYSELSNFFYIWLRELIKHPYYNALYVPSENEAIVNKYMAKDAFEYADLLQSVFRESSRVLKNGGNLIFTYHSTKIEAWWAVLNSIKGSGFVVTDFFPVMSEYKVNPHIRNKQSLDMDLVLVCSKKEIDHKSYSTIQAEILNRAVNDLPINTSYNKLFLHFMGELLRAVSIASPVEILDYEWFTETLEHFDEFIKNRDFKQTSEKNNVLKKHQTELFDD